MRTLIVLLSDHDAPVLGRVISDFAETFRGETGVGILLIDDDSRDGSFAAADRHVRERAYSNVRVFRSRRPQGPGGNQKVGFRRAAEEGYDAVVPVRIGEAYPAALARELIASLEKENADAALATFRSRPGLGGLLVRALSRLQAGVAAVRFEDWHTPCRAYRTAALSRISFELNTAESHFDTEVLLQLVDRGGRFARVPMDWTPPLLPRNLAGIGRIKNELKAVLRYRLQRYNLFYDARFHPEFLAKSLRPLHGLYYEEKAGSESPHSFVCGDPGLIPPGARVLDIGCSTGYVARALKRSRACRVTGVDVLPTESVDGPDEYQLIDIEKEADKVRDLLERGDYDVVLLLDVLEHLAVPELFLLTLFRAKCRRPPKFVMSTGNVAFIVVRLMLLLGYFNYGEKGILDITHKRLFSTRTFRNLLDQTGFLVLETRGFPLPYKSLGFRPGLCRLLEGMNRFLIRLRPSLFAYQVLHVAAPLEAPGTFPEGAERRA